MTTVDEFIAHVGVKGMKWGIRKKSDDSVAPSEDATRASKSYTIAKKHGTKALSNDDLRDLVNRMNLEQQYSRLTSEQKKKNKGLEFVSEIFMGVLKKQTTAVLNDAISKKIGEKMNKPDTKDTKTKTPSPPTGKPKSPKSKPAPEKIGLGGYL